MENPEKQKRLEEITEKIKNVDRNSKEWADLILESSALLNGQDQQKVYNLIIEQFKKDFPSQSKDFNFINGYIEGLDLCTKYAEIFFPINVGFIHSYNLSRAALIKYLQTFKN